MRILQVNGQHRKVGGTEVYLHQLIDALRARGHTVGLFAQDAETERAEPELCVVRRADFDPEHLILDPACAAAFSAFASTFRADVLHLHNLHNFPATFARAVGELGVPVLLHPHEFGLLCPNAWCVWPDGTPCSGGPGKKCFEHGCERNYPFDARNVLAERLRMEHCRALAAATVCGSDALAELMRANGFAGARTLRYFAEPEKFGGLAALAKLRAETPRERERVLFLGRLEPEKGVSTLLQAMAIVRRTHPAAALHVVGGGTLRAELEREAETLALAAVFHGPVPHHDVPSHLARATVQVLPSIWAENAAQSCYDCMLLGLPLVASRVAALPEIVRDEVSGLLFTPRDAQDLARQILRVLEEPGLAARLSAGCAGELARYDKDAHLVELERLYAELVALPARVHAKTGDEELEFMIEELNRFLLHKERTASETFRHMRGGRVRRLVNNCLDVLFSQR